MEVLSDAVLELAVDRVLGESEAQVLTEVTSYGGICREGTEEVGELREIGGTHLQHTSPLQPHYLITLTLSDYLAF